MTSIFKPIGNQNMHKTLPGFKKQKNGKNFKTVIASINKIALQLMINVNHPTESASDRLIVQNVQDIPWRYNLSLVHDLQSEKVSSGHETGHECHHRPLQDYWQVAH